MNLKNRIDRIENKAKVTLTTVRELVDYFLRVQRGEVSIHGAVLAEHFINMKEIDAATWRRQIDAISQKYGVPREQVIQDLIARKPELAQVLQVEVTQ